MKLFFASDLHGSLPATEKVIALYQQSQADYLVLLGDILNHGPRNPIPEGYNPPEVAQRLNQLSQQIIAVRGNCDSEVDQMLLEFPMMADYSWLLLPTGQRMFLTHGHTYNKAQHPLLNDNDILVHGHTHIPVAEKQDDIMVFNPGSVTFPREGYTASYAILDEQFFKVMNFNGDVLMEQTLN